MEKFNFALFKEICEVGAISGDEVGLTSILKKYYEKYSDEIICDNLGSFVVHKKSKCENTAKVMVLAHADEIGFMVSHIESNGVIRVNAIGGINPQTLLGNRVTLKNSEGKLFDGVISSTSAGNSIKDLEFDFGFDSKEEALNNNICIGNSVFFVGEAIKLNDKRVVAKAIDDRYGVFLTIELLEELENIDLDVDLYVGVSVQEEVGCRGAQTITRKINPDFAIVLDCSPSDPKNNNGILGNGVLLRVKDANMISFKTLIEYQKNICEKLNVPYQYFISAGGTDAGVIHKENNGILTLTHCICAKNLHTFSTIMDVNDYLNAKKSLLYVVKNLNLDKIENFKRANR